MQTADVTMELITAARKISIKPGDKLFIETDKTLSPSQFDSVRGVVKQWAGLPDDESVLILQNGMTLRVLSKEASVDVSTGNP